MKERSWTTHGKAARGVLAGQMLVLLVCLWRQSAGAVESPLDVIRTTTRQALAVLDNPMFQGDAQKKKRLKKMWEVILPHFDQQALAQSSLGIYWRGLTREQQTHFTDLFLQMVKNSYSSTLDLYTTNAQFFFDAERINGDYAEVDTRILTPTQSDAFSVVYHLHQREAHSLAASPPTPEERLVVSQHGSDQL